MTRGQIAIIKKGWNENSFDIMTSIEFNGDMYMPTKKWKGHGRQVINLLKKVYDVASYQLAVAKFNNDNHHYNDCDHLTYNIKGEDAAKMLNFKVDYFENWCSDYVYIKNLCKEEMMLTDESGKPFTLKNGEIAVVNFGSLKKIVSPTA